MTNKDKDEQINKSLQARFSDIYKKHPRIDLTEFAKILAEIRRMLNAKEDVTVTEVSKKAGLKRTKTYSRIYILKQEKYLKITGRTKDDRPVMFLAVEHEKLAFGRNNIEKLMTKKIDELLDFLKQKSLEGTYKAEITKLGGTSEDNEKIDVYNKLSEIVNRVYSKSFAKMGFKTKAYRIQLTSKGESC